MRSVFNSICPILPLWSIFKYKELLQNMRQKENLEYAELLNRMRVQQLNEKDIEILKKRVIIKKNEPNKMECTAKFYANLINRDATVLALFPLNDEVVSFNCLVVKYLDVMLCELPADDNNIVDVQKSKKKKNRPCKEF